MAQPRRRPRESTQASTRSTVARVADAQRDSAVDSPARLMQQALSLDMVDEDLRDRWPPSATLAFILVTCGGFWITAIYMTMQFIKAH